MPVWRKAANTTPVSLKSADGARFQPDVLIHLPGDKQVVVDAKVSLTAYRALTCAEDEGSRALALKQHVQSLRNHLRGFRSRTTSIWRGCRASISYCCSYPSKRHSRRPCRPIPSSSRRPTVGTS